ncbi:M20 family metallo-hydrolase [Nocardia tengchongensis]
MNPSPDSGTAARSPRTTADDAAFLADFTTMSGFGATEAGGVERQAATAADALTRRWLAEWLRERGFQVKRDRIGNLFGLLEVTPGAPYVLIGSHLDSQPRGGRFDGAYGVLAGAHAIDRVRRQLLSEPGGSAVNLAVVDWFNEEGSRFKPSMMGSSVYCGKLDLETALATTDSNGTSVRDALTFIGELGDDDIFDASGAPVAYVEIHIEQGKILDKQGVDIGLVTSTWAANKYEISVHGAQAHTGSTEMADRQDALYGAALAVTAVRELADRYDRELHTSCGQLTVYPNSPVVVAREVRMHLDLRSPDDEILAAADEYLRRQFAQIEVRANVRIEKRHAHTWTANYYQAEGVELARAAVEDLGLSNVEIRTRAGHDSTNMKDLVPSIMLFIPSVDGISHSELEYSHDRDLCNGVDLVTEILLRLSSGHDLAQPAV